MKLFLMRALTISSFAVGAAMPSLAQTWEVGALGGGSFHLDRPVTGAVSGKAGLKPGFAAGGWIGHSGAGRWGGEIRYQFQKADLRASSNGQSVTFAAQSHLVHYDILLHSNSTEDSVRPFVAFGGGMKGYRGTGAERAFQPLSNVAALSAVRQWQPMLSFGGGVKWRVGNRMTMRAEVRDFVTPFPKDVILPAPGNKISGFLHDITPMFGVSYLF